MKLFPVVLKRAVEGMLIFLTLTVTVFILWQALSYLIPRELVVQIQSKARLSLGLSAYPTFQLPQVVLDANSDHKLASAWVTRCMGTPASNKFSIDMQFLLDGVPTSAKVVAPEPVTLRVPPLYLRVLGLSQSLIWKRWAVDAKLIDSYKLAKIGSYASILIGFLTTVVVGLSALPRAQDATKVGTRLKFAALVLPALGTAVAAIIAFHDPGGTLARQSQVAAGLQQLHDQIARATWKMPCATGADDAVPKEVERNLETWEQGLRELTSSTGDTRTQGGKPGANENQAAPK
jgi:hypothetical protein